MGNLAPQKYYRDAKVSATAGGSKQHCVDSFVFDIIKKSASRKKKYFNIEDAQTLLEKGSGQFRGYAGELASEDVSKTFDFYMFQAQDWTINKYEFYTHKAAIIRHVQSAASKIYELIFKEVVDDFPIFLVVIDTDNSNFSDNILANAENFKLFSSVMLKQNNDLDALGLSENRFLVADVDNILNRIVTGKEGTRPLIEGIKGHLAGLINLGNTCYMNSAITSLAHMRPLRQFFRNQFNEYNVNPREQGVFISVQFYRLLRQMQASGAKITPTELKRDIGIVDPRFADFTQNDAHICLSTLIFNIHDDINEVIKKPYYPNPPTLTEFKTIDGIAKETWARHLQRERSAIVEMMNGMYVVEKKCDTCGLLSPKFDIMHSVPLQIQKPKRYKGHGNLTLIDLLNVDRESQTVEDYECSKCEFRTTAKSTIKIYRVPRILIFQIKRFKEDYGRYVIDDTEIDYPEDLYMNDFWEDKSSESMYYRLFSVIVHEGNLDAGHYYTYGRNDRGQWAEYDDAKIRMVDSPKNKDAYILFYERI